MLSASSSADPRSSDPSPCGSSSIGEANPSVGDSSSVGSISFVSLGVAKRRKQM